MKKLKKRLLILMLIIGTMGHVNASDGGINYLQAEPLPDLACYVYCTYEVAFNGIGVATYQCFAGVCSIIDFRAIGGQNEEELTD